jgi:CubicO group peptidase (beta-lactamase class C family)
MRRKLNGAAMLFLASAAIRIHGFEWQTATPQSQGMSSLKMEGLKDQLASRNTKTLLLIRNDKIVYEWYAPGFGASKTHFTASMAKGLVGGISVAVALSDNRVSLDEPISKFVPQWKDDPQKSRITLRQLGSHTSGLADAEDSGIAHEKLTGWKGDFWKRLPPPNDPFTIARDKTPILFPPGSQFQYSNPGMAMLAYALTAALKDSPEKDLRTLLRVRVMQPLGVTDREWSIGYGETVSVEGLPLVATWGGGAYTPRTVARVGRLLLHKGTWQGREILTPSAVEQITSDAGTPHNAGIGWWSNNDGTSPNLPKDSFWASGAGHQIVLVIPSRNFIAVRNGGSLGPTENYDAALQKYFFEPLAEIFAAEKKQSEFTSPPSPVIKGITWSPKETIIRKAKGSDNWPVTWGDDDVLYTAYGDGNGFEPFVPEKLSLGLARITGFPSDFAGTNLRSASIEQKGDGRAGKKASGILMVHNTLYLWARNAGNSQLTWSADHGLNWTWSDWKFEFGCPTFLNFGKNYQNARDDFIYIFSHDSEDAYTATDRFVLARVPSSKIQQRDAYEFFQKLNDNGKPIWIAEFSRRGAVFSNPGRCYRSNVSYNAPLKRYLWCQTLPGGDARFQGGFAIYDAAEPWGPWTSVFQTETWDVGPGESSSFPTKWISSDGKTAYLVFSGDDNFCVRKANLVIE